MLLHLCKPLCDATFDNKVKQTLSPLLKGHEIVLNVSMPVLSWIRLGHAQKKRDPAKWPRGISYLLHPSRKHIALYIVKHELKNLKWAVNKIILTFITLIWL